LIKSPALFLESKGRIKAKGTQNKNKPVTTTKSVCVPSAS